LSWYTQDSEGAFVSIKLTMAGFRYNDSGTTVAIGFNGIYWNSSISGSVINTISYNSGGAAAGGFYRAIGLPVRCIKN